MRSSLSFPCGCRRGERNGGTGVREIAAADRGPAWRPGRVRVRDERAGRADRLAARRRRSRRRIQPVQRRKAEGTRRRRRGRLLSNVNNAPSPVESRN